MYILYSSCAFSQVSTAKLGRLIEATFQIESFFVKQCLFRTKHLTSLPLVYTFATVIRTQPL